MFAMVIDQPGEAEVLQPKDVETPQPGPHDVLVKTAACGVCYHDLLLRNGTMKRGVPFPLIVGHEPSGVVERVGSEVRSVAPGDRVASHPVDRELRAVSPVSQQPGAAVLAAEVVRA